MLVTTRVRSMIPADLASYTEVDLLSGRVIAPLDPPIDASSSIASLPHWAYQHPLIAQRYDRAHTISDFLGERQYRRLGLYANVYRPLEAEDQLAIQLVARPGTVIGVALNRSRRSFSEADRMTLELLRPVLLRAYRRLALREDGDGELTRREREILSLVASGHTNQQIATRLELSRRTVENHLQSIYRKLGVSNRTAAAAALAPTQPRIAAAQSSPAPRTPRSARPDAAAATRSRARCR